jgi:hypothetical protein
MIKTLNQSNFIDEMTFSEGSSYKNCFSYDGIVALFNYYEEYEEDTGEQIECDPIGLCCEWSEYSNFEDIQAEYNDLLDMDDLTNKTTVINCDNGGLIIRKF